MKLTYGKIKATCARVLQMTATDTRTLEYANRAMERLIEGMKAKGTTFRYRLTTDESRIVLPRHIETVERHAIENCPGIVRNKWFEYIPGGNGIQETDSCYNNSLILHDEVACFRNVSGENKKLAIQTTLAEASGGYVILHFYNEDGELLRTLDGASYIDGEKVTIPTVAGTYAYTTNFCQEDGFVAAIKTVTNGAINLFEYTPADGTVVPMAIWAWDEEVPQYRSTLVPGLESIADGEDKTVIIEGKARFIPARADNDLLIIQSVEAIRLACQAIAKEEKDLFTEANTFWAMAFRVLDNQLNHYNGDGAVAPIQIQNIGPVGSNIPSLI